MRYKRLTLSTVAALASTVAVLVGTISCSTATDPQPATHWTTTITADISGPAVGVLNSHYIGLSFGSNEINSGKLDNVGNLPKLLRNLGSSVMRFGGIEADVSFKGSTRHALAALARLTKASGWSVFYTENIGELNVADISADARAVRNALGSNLSAFACGNEPDLFHFDGLRPSTYSVGDYLSDAANCIAAIHAGAPNALIEGPETVSEPSWPAAYAVSEAGIVNWFGIHFYALPCGLQGKTPAQRAVQLFSQASTAREVWWFKWAAADAKTAHASLWMTEVNTACNGGDPGLSDTYASALWIIDYLLLGAEHGVSGMNVQGGLTACRGYQGYSPLCEVGANKYAAEPIYYGMLFTHLLGTGNLVPVTVSSRTSARDIAAFALKPSTGGLRVIIENFGQHQTSVGLSASTLPADATVLHLTAPSLLATSGIKIQGATVNANGALKPGSPDHVQCSTDGCPITIAPHSAVLVSL